MYWPKVQSITHIESITDFSQIFRKSNIVFPDLKFRTLILGLKMSFAYVLATLFWKTSFFIDISKKQ